MAILKCKMCGGSLEQTDSAVVVCEYCGTKQTVPLLDDEKKIQLFDRANSYRTNCEFDKASLLYEEILSEYPDNAEAHWGVCLCKYGIEYVEDRLRDRRTPTCHRTQFRSILEDTDYLAAIKYAEISAKEVYRQEAEYIDTVQRGILAISAKEEPFDIFICYKETDSNGDRTKDSVIAQEIYNDLTDMGYKVFFSRITLEDKLGIAYEPYIFAALNSAPLMLIVGTKPEYFNAVWVKNEWSRYLRMIEQGQKKTVVPCYRDMSASEMPVEFSVLQAQDVSKVGWKQDLLRGISKILPLGEKEEVKPDTQPQKAPTGFVISTITSCGAAHANDCWPKTPISSVININQYPCVSFRATMQRPFSEHREVSLNYTITDALGNRICADSSRIRVTPGNDRLAQVWVLRDSSGRTVSTGDYRITMNVDGGESVTYAFKVINTATESQKQKGFAISTITSCGAAHANDCWPKTPISSVININQYPCVSFQATMQRAFSENREISLNYVITDALGNRVLADSSRIRVAPGNDRLAQVWVLRDSSGRMVSTGDYRITMNVDGGESVTYAFKVINTIVNTTSQNNSVNYAPPVKKNKSRVSYVLFAFLLGYFGVHSFYVGNKIKGIAQLVVFLIATAVLDVPIWGDIMSVIGVFWPWTDAIIALIKGVPKPKK